MRKEQFDVTGMTCSACSSRVQKTVAGLAGVREVTVNLLKNSMVVSFDEAATSEPVIVAAVEKAGYGATPHAPSGQRAEGEAPRPDPAAQEARDMRYRLAVSLLFTAPLFLLAMGPMIGLPLPGFLRGPENSLANALTQLLLTVPVLFVNGRYYRVGFKTLFSGAPNMDSLIAIGSGAAVVFSVYALYGMAHALGRGNTALAGALVENLYFDSAAMILTLITLGKFFEARAKGKTSEAIARLLDLAPKNATVLREGREETVPVAEVRVGDRLVVKSGESVPVDGVIEEGGAFVDESALTGESVPVEKQAEDRVTGASIVTSGHLIMRATRVGEDTTLSRIIRLVDEATSSKAPISRLADRISGIFVPVVIAVAVAATAYWLLAGQGLEFSLSIGIAVLVISCPCALGLATPTAIMVGTGRGAAAGILIKSAEAIEIAQAVDTVVLDKTGTVTEGRPEVTDLVPATGVSGEELLRVAASLEKMSEHPLGQAIVRAAGERGLELEKVSGFSQTPGQGISGVIAHAACLAGNRKLLEGRGIAVAPALSDKAEALAAEGRTALFFVRGGETLGVIGVADRIKPGSREAVAELEAMGLEVIMLTGDNARTAAAVQKQAGIRRVLAEVLPEDKEREVRALQEQGRKVAMVGDGINDAPALARADVGLAIGAGTDIAIESADIVLMKSDLRDVPAAVRLSRAVMRTIRQNLFWAFFYNSVGIPVAAGVFYNLWGLTLSPMLAAAAMSMSSVSVVSNALRLRFFIPRRLPAPQTEAAAPAAGTAGDSPALVSATSTRSTKMIKTIRIEGMSCGHCSAAVEKALNAVPGVSGVRVDLAGKTATLEAGAQVSDETLKTAVTDAGYQVVGIE